VGGRSTPCPGRFTSGNEPLYRRLGGHRGWTGRLRISIFGHGSPSWRFSKDEKVIPVQVAGVQALRFQDNRQSGKFVSPTHRPSLPSRNISWRRIADGRVKLMKNSSDSNGNQTRDFPPYSAVPQPTAPPTYKISISGCLRFVLSCAPQANPAWDCDWVPPYGYCVLRHPKEI
jgi:hypothetical protein